MALVQRTLLPNMKVKTSIGERKHIDYRNRILCDECGSLPLSCSNRGLSTVFVHLEAHCMWAINQEKPEIVPSSVSQPKR